MKIGFAGNTNNVPFILARAMRELGHEVLFIVDRLEPLQRPEHRFPDIPYPYPDWIHELLMYHDLTYAVPTPNRQRIVALLRSCDAVILNAGAPALIPLLDRPAMAFLTGADLYVYASDDALAGLFVNKWPVWFWSAIKRLLCRQLRPRQRAGIRQAQVVNYLIRGIFPEHDAMLARLGADNGKRLEFMMTDLELARAVPPPHNPTPRVLCATRLNWLLPFPPGYAEMDYKGSDVMIRGLAQFRREIGRDLEVRIIKKGLHVRETMALAEQLGVSDQITWLDEMSQRQVLEETRRADIIIEQLDRSLVAQVGLDAMATGRPVIGNGRPEIFEPFLGVPSPICQATTPADVCRHLQRLTGDAAAREQEGELSAVYVRQYFSPARVAALCLERLQAHVP